MNRSPFATPYAQGTMRRNLRYVYRKATESERLAGAAWYPDARRIVSEWSLSYSLPRETVACIIAALSPQVSWERNLIIADDLCAGREPSIGALRANVRKAQTVRDIEETSLARVFPFGPKVNAFSLNLSGDDSAVTVDVHALQAAMNDPTLTSSLKTSAYDAVATAYASTAYKLNLLPTTFQATVWLVWKRLYSPGRKRTLTRQRGLGL